MRLSLLCLAACTAPDLAESFNHLEVELVDGEDAVVAAFVDLADVASDSLHVALPAGESIALGEAILDAWDRGVEVEVVTDVDRADDAAIDLLLQSEVPVTLADDGIQYFDFNQNVDVSWTSEQTIMSHAFAVADRQRIVAANRAGFLGDEPRVLFRLEGEEIVEDILTEHNQVFGGADAVATTAFDGMAKSVADARWLYRTQSDLDLQIWFGPQERLTKRVIDQVYAARANVWVMTDDFANEGLAKALQDKAAWGFDVKVVVGPGFGSTSSLLSNLLRQTPDVEKVQVTDAGHLPTIVLVDFQNARDGLKHTSYAYVLTHDLYSAARIYRGAEVVNDQLIDGALWVVSDYGAIDARENAELVALYEFFQATFERGGDL